MKIVIKIGGAALEDKDTLKKCAQAVVQLAQDGHQVAVVHGGGSALTRTLKLLGKQSDFIHGLRVTDAETRDVALMVLAGIVNKSLVAAIAGRAIRPSVFAVETAESFVLVRNKTPNTIWGLSAKFVFPSRAGSKPSGLKVASRCSPRLRWAATASITT
jgi:acetylglutamate kinase